MKVEASLEGEGDTWEGEVGLSPGVIASAVTKVDFLAVIQDEESEGGVEIHFEDSDVNLCHIGDAEADELLLKLGEGAVFFGTHKLCLKFAAIRSGLSPELGKNGLAGLA